MTDIRDRMKPPKTIQDWMDRQLADPKFRASVEREVKKMRAEQDATVNLTPDLARKMLRVWEHRQRDDPATVYPESLLAVALRTPDHPPQPPRKFEFAGSLKRPNWKHDKGSRG